MAPQKMEQGGHGKIFKGAVVLAAGLMAYGGFEAVENMHLIPGFHLNIGDTGDGPASGHSTDIPGTTTEKVVNLECDGAVTTAVGSVAVSHYSFLGLQVGGYYISKAFPVREAECAPGGFSAAEQIESVNGTVTEVDIPTFSYSPAFEGIDELSPLICVHENADASAQAIEDAVDNYKNNQGCDPAGQTTGMGTNAHGAGNTEEVARRDSVIAATITPISHSIEHKFESDLISKLKEQAHKEYPHAKLYVETPQTDSDFQQTLNGWNNIRLEAVRDFDDIHFSKDGNKLELSVSTKGASGQVYVSEDLTKNQINILNSETTAPKHSKRSK